MAQNDNLMPEKYFAVSKTDGCLYLYDKSATPNQTTGKYTKFEGGGGTVTGIKIGTTDYTPVSGIVTLPEYPTASSGGNTASWGSSVTVGTVGGIDLKFTMPSNPNTNTTYSLSVSGTSIKLTPSSGTADTITVPYATYAGLLAYSHTNEINFKGGAQGTVYFNYRNADTDAAATSANITYKFCNYNNDTSKTTIEAASFTGNAATATKATQDGNGNVISSTYLKSVPKASSSVYGGAKIYASGDVLYITTT